MGISEMSFNFSRGAVAEKAMSNVISQLREGGRRKQFEQLCSYGMGVGTECLVVPAGSYEAVKTV